MTIGKNDVFERKYEARFRALLAPFGEFVVYERDRAARDLGIHLTKPAKGGAETLSGSLCWFQLKGIQATTLAAGDARRLGSVPITLSTEHLRFWYTQPAPTWLALYVESLDTFLILNLQAVVAEKFGDEILTRERKTTTIQVPLGSVLDEHALSLILRAGELPLWARVTRESAEDLRWLQRDSGLIWRFGTAAARKVEHYMEIIDWQSKLRGEVHFFERPTAGGDWQEVRQHWQLMLRSDAVEEAFPFLTLRPTEESGEEPWDDDGVPTLELTSGETVYGVDASSEYFSFELTPRLNDFGIRLYRALEDLRSKGLLYIDPDEVEFTDSAPWHDRSV